MKALSQKISAHRRDIVVLNLVALGATILLWVFLSGKWAEDQNFDYFTYYQPVARRLLNGGGLREATGAPATHYPPGFSILLAGVFGAAKLTGISEGILLKCFILICGLLTATLLYLIAMQVFSARIALIAGLLWATYPFFLWLSKQPNSETPFMVLFLAAICSYVAFWPDTARLGWPAARTSILAGLTSLVRPAAFLLSVVLAVLLLCWRRDLRMRQRLTAAVLLLVGNVIAILPWEVWVWQQKGHWILLSENTPNNLVVGMNFGAKPQGSGVLLPVDANVRELMRDADAHYYRITTVGGLARYLLEKARQEPVTVLQFLLLKARRAWYGTNAQWLENWTAAIQIVYLCAIVAGAVIALRRRGPPRHYAVLAILCTCYIWALTVLVLPLLRYMIPAMSLLIVLMAVFIDWLIQHARGTPALST